MTSCLLPGKQRSRHDVISACREAIDGKSERAHGCANAACVEFRVELETEFAIAMSASKRGKKRTALCANRGLSMIVIVNHSGD
jgi:hypothetical protein